MHTLITFATQWGSKHGGINSFNADFLAAFGFAYNLSVQIICIVASASSEEIEEASKAHVQLVPLPYTPEARVFGPEHGQAGVEEINRLSISFDPDNTLWLGHDRITGEAAIAAAKSAGGRSSVIHHMSYDHYESYAENSQSAHLKTQAQIALFDKADVVLAVGPLLRNAAIGLLSKPKTVHMLIPGLAEIEPKEPPATFVAFLSGRLSDDAARIKQGHLGIAAFSKAQREARQDGMPDALCNQPKLLLRGVDFEGRVADSHLRDQPNPEAELKQFAFDYADAVVNLHALPYIQDRQQLYSELSKASVALMPSWHEGFGLVAWEAIAAGVPLIVSRKSGVYCLLDEAYPGAGTGCVYSLDVRGAITAPYVHPDDLKETVRLLKAIANNSSKARKQASILRNMLGDHTWAACAGQAAKAFGWELKKGSLPDITIDSPAQTPGDVAPTPTQTQDKQRTLQMPAPQWRAGAGMADSQLLRAEEALLPFDPARQPDVDSLNNWLDDSQWPLAVRLITGAGGQGKTRLALELCQQRQSSGWYTGFLDSNLEANKMTGTWQALRNLNQPLLIVVDYAETRQPAFLALIKAAQQNPVSQPVRMLLLARDGGEWWDNLPSKDPECEALLSGYATTGPYPLPALYEAQHDRQVAYRKALHAFAKALEASAPDIVPDLAGEHFERPLYVQMAALLALYGERPTTAQGLTKALLNHERRYWQRLLSHFNWPEPERRAEQLLALSTLAGGFATPRTAEPCWKKAKVGVLKTSEFNSLFRALETLYPGAQGLEAMRPDLLGEALVAQALLRHGADTILDAVLSSIASQPIRRNALTVLARLSTHRLDLQETLVDGLSRHFALCYKDIVEVSIETLGQLPELAELAFSRLSPSSKSQVAGQLADLLIEESVRLANLNCLVGEYLVEKSHEKFKKKPGNLDRTDDYARALVGYALALSRNGRWEQACDIALKGLELSRQLADKNPDRFEPDYARSLSNYANRLSDVGRHEEALDHARQALEIHKRLADKNPDRFEPNYARSLNNYAKSLSDVGRDEEALDHDCEALSIRKRLVQRNPDHFEPDYATSLSNYASDLSEVGRDDEALDHARQALEIRKQLAQKNPDRFEPNYAMSLSNYANRLGDAGRYEEALDHARQALEIRKQLAQKSLHRFADNLFSSTCFVHFLAWLYDQDVGSNKPDLNQLLTSVPSRQRSLMLLFSEFVDACWAADRTARAYAFRGVISNWGELSIADKHRAQPYWLCAAAWCTKFEPADVAGTGWEVYWKQFVKQRKGRVPQWMLEVARRLDFQWPE